MAQRSLLASIPMASLLLMVSASVAGASGGLAVSEPQVQPDPAITIDSAWGWAVDRRPTVSSHVPAPKDRGNSSGGTNTIIRNRVGGYTVRMAGLGAPGGVALVSAFGTPGAICRVDAWWRNGSKLNIGGGSVQVTAYGSSKARWSVASIRTSGSPQKVGVRCYGVNGAPADSMFTFSHAR